MKSMFFLIAILLLFSCGGNNTGVPDGPIGSDSPARDKPVVDSPTNTGAGVAQGDCDLIRKIIQLQRQEVRDSYGINAGQAFTARDLQAFQANGVTARIVQDLRTDRDFACVINSLRGMTSQNRTAILDSARNTYRLSWADLGMDPQNTAPEQLRRGQTDAGKEAEMSIAQAVVGLANEKLREQ